jgi:ribonuclease III
VARALGVPERMRSAAPADQPHLVDAPIGSDSVLAEAVEAAIGACFLAFGFDRTREAVATAFHPQVETAVATMFDFKSELQERLAQRGEIVSYTVVDERGPPHDRRFETAAEVGGRRLGSGVGRSKKESEQEAAKEALAALGEM